jgi:hypothetical protein
MWRRESRPQSVFDKRALLLEGWAFAFASICGGSREHVNICWNNSNLATQCWRHLQRLPFFFCYRDCPSSCHYRLARERIEASRRRRRRRRRRGARGGGGVAAANQWMAQATVNKYFFLLDFNETNLITYILVIFFSIRLTKVTQVSRRTIPKWIWDWVVFSLHWV